MLLKTRSLSMQENLDDWGNLQNDLMQNWFSSMNGVFNSLTNFVQITNENIDTFSNFQNQNLKTHLGNGATATEKKTKKDESKLSRISKENKTDIALVTGGVGGIGTVICQRLADDNAKIIATYISFEKEHALQWRDARIQEGMDVEIVECDVSNFEDCQLLAEKLEKEHGHIDVLVNCAGITRDAMLKKLEKENWDAVIQTNLDSVFNMTRNFIDGMIKRGYGRIINISSVNGQKGQFGQTNYSSAKAGMIGFTRSLAIELADKGITVNCVCPGYVSTSMVEAIPDHIKQSIISQIPAGRLAKPVEIADAVGFLASRKSAYITGTELAVNGGLWTG